MIKDEQYIEIYNKFGSDYYCIANDDLLRKWGNSEKRIRDIKVNAVKSDLEWCKSGIESYKMLNELCGGKNVI